MTGVLRNVCIVLALVATAGARGAAPPEATPGHMHEARFEFVGPHELRAQWISWKDGKRGDHIAGLHVMRVKH